jgi:hypothetical protein
MTDEVTNVPIVPAGTDPAIVGGDTGKGFNLADVRVAFHDAVESVEMGEDGNLDMRIRPQEPVVETPESDGPSEPPEAPLADTPEYETEDLLAEIDTWEDRYKNLQGAYTTGQQALKEQGERIARLEGKLEAGVQTPPTDEADSWADAPDPSAQDIDALVAKRVDAALKDAVPQDVDELVQDWKIGKELQEVIAAHDDFPAYVPAIQHLLDTVETDLSYEEAYQIARKFGQPTEIAPAPTAPVGVPAPVADTAPAAQPVAANTHAELVQKSQALKTAQGNTNDAGFVEVRAVESPRDAIMQALEDTYGS